MRERWERLLGSTTGSFTGDYMQAVFPNNAVGDTTYINAAVFGNKKLISAISALEQGYALLKGDTIIAARMDAYPKGIDDFNKHISGMPPTVYDGDIYTLSNNWDIFSLNDKALRDDFAIITEGRTSAMVPADITVSGHDNLFIEEGARIHAGCIINASTGPVYIAKDAEVMEGTIMRGPIALCEHSVVKMGAKLYGATTIGPGCKVGGEINNVVFFANSNKAHDGYLGNAVIGEWL